MKHVSVPRSRKVTKGDTIKRLESDNAALREALKELIPIAEHAKDPWDFSEDNIWKVSIDKAKDLLKP